MKAMMSVSLEDGEIVILFVPKADKPEHYHIHLTPQAAEHMATVLDAFAERANDRDTFDIPVDKVT